MSKDYAKQLQILRSIFWCDKKHFTYILNESQKLLKKTISLIQSFCVLILQISKGYIHEIWMRAYSLKIIHMVSRES